MENFLLHLPANEVRAALLANEGSFSQIICLSGVSMDYPYGCFEEVMAISDKAITPFFQPGEDPFNRLKQFMASNPDRRMYGILGYDLKNYTERLTSTRPDTVGFPQMHFFIPEAELFFRGETTEVRTTDPDLAKKIRLMLEKPGIYTRAYHPVNFSGMPFPGYCERVAALQKHIRRGDVYEVNFCTAFRADTTLLHPGLCFLDLMKVSPMPFSCFVKLEDKYLVCASPERFLKLQDGKLISQPIKGTSRRGVGEEEDHLLKSELQYSEKELAENAMIVDLVRNDLSRVAEDGTVSVEEFCGLYTFKKVHQLISTITAGLGKDIHPVDALRLTFPMGSMTGAPKISAMELIEKYEDFTRGLFSGSVGYIDPSGNVDFNVVIRSLLYNQTEKKLIAPVGSAITADALPEKEYEECKIKLGPVLEALNGLK